MRQLILNAMKRNLPIFQLSKTNNITLPFTYGLELNQQSSSNGIHFSTATNAEVASSDDSKKIENNPYYSKYAEKIKKAQLQNKIESEKNVEQKQNPTIEGEFTVKNDDQLNSEINSVKELAKKFPGKKSKKNLDDIVKIELLENKSKDEIANIWNMYHSKRDCIYSVIPTEIYQTFYNNLVQYPTFLLPLPRNTDQQSAMSYEFFLMQYQDHNCHFTPLAAYHLHKEMAPVCLNIHYYPELSESKGIVLMMGEFDSNILNIMECQGLTNQLQYYYLTKESAPKLSLHLFNKEPKSFDHMRLIKHLENGLCSQSSINLNQPD